MRWSRTATGATVAAGIFAITASVALGSAVAVSDPAGTIETSPVTSVMRGSYTVLGGDVSAWVQYGAGDAPLGIDLVSTDTQDLITIDHPELVSADTGLGLVSGDHLVGQDFLGTQAAAVNLANGQVSVNDLSGFASYSNIFVAGATSTGWVVSADDVNGTKYFVQPYAGGAPTELVQPGDAFRFLASCSAGTLAETLETADLGSGPQSVYRLRLYASNGASNRLVTTQGDGGVGTAGCSATTIAWTSAIDGSLAHQPVGGGATVTQSAPTPDNWYISGVAGGVVGLTNGLTSELATWSGASAPVLATLPDGYSMSGAYASALTNGTPAIMANVQDLDGQGKLLWFTGGASAVQSLDGPVQYLFSTGLGASAGKVYDQLSADYGVPQADDRTAPLFVRSVGGSPLAFGSSSSYITRASAYLGSFLDRSSSFRQGLGVSGDRAAIPTWPSASTTIQELTLLDRGVRKTGIPLPTRAAVISQSGPYTAVIPGSSTQAGFVVLPDGHVVAKLPTGLGQVVMDGSRAVYVASDGSVWVRDVAKATSSSNPKKVMNACGSATVECGRRIAVWGGTIAAATIRNSVPFGAIRTVPVAGGTERILSGLTGAVGLSLRGSVLLYVTDDPNVEIRVADLSLATPASVLVADNSTDGISRALLDGHQVLWQTSTTVKAAPIPASVDSDSAPRLLGMFGATTLGRNGGALTLPWTPQFDLDSQIDSWTLTIKKGSTVIKTFTGSGPTAGIRGISWDGKSTGGTIVAPGSYTWTLTGSNADGSLKSASGSGSATGTLTVVTTVKSALSIAASPKIVVYGSTATVSGKLVKSGTTTGLGGEAVQLYSKPAGTSTWKQVATAWTTASGAVSFTVRPTATVAYQLRHAKSGQSFASSSTSATVASKFKLTAAYSASTVKRGGTFKVSGTLAPAAAGAKVVVQRLSGGVWKTVKTLSVTSGKYSGSVSVGSTAGTFSYRVLKAADATHLLATTATKAIKVT